MNSKMGSKGKLYLLPVCKEKRDYPKREFFMDCGEDEGGDEDDYGGGMELDVEEDFNEEEGDGAPEQAGEDTSSPRCLYFTIPVSTFKPYVRRFRDFTSEPTELFFKTFFLIFVHMVDTCFYSDKKERRMMKSGKNVARVSCYLQYIPPASVQREDFEKLSFNDFVGIRLVVVIRDSTIDVNAGFKAMFEENAKVLAVLNKKKKGMGFLYNELYCFYNVVDFHYMISMIKSYLRVYTLDEQDEYACISPADNMPKEGSILDLFNVFSINNSKLPDTNDPTQCFEDGEFPYPELVFRIPGGMKSRYILFYTPPLAVGWYDMPPKDAHNSAVSLMKLMERVGDNHPFPNEKTLFTEFKDVCCSEYSKFKYNLYENTESYNTWRMLKISRLACYFYHNGSIAEPLDIIADFAKSEMSEVDCTVDETMFRNYNISKFANVMLYLYDGFEYTLDFLQTHSDFLLVMCSALDSLRYDFKLKFNILIAGKAGKGKSYLLNSIEKNFLEGTFKNPAHVTKFSDTNDMDENCILEIQHEASENIISDKDNATGNPVIKTRLSEQKVLTSQTVVEDGRRIKMMYKSEKIGSMVMNSNQSTYSVPEPIRDRFWIIQLVNNTRKFKGNINRDMMHSICESSLFDDNYTPPIDDDEFKKAMKYIQVNTAVIELLIATKLIPDVNIQCMKRIMASVSIYLVKNRWIPAEPGTREIAKIYALCRKIVIIQAILIFFNDPTQHGFKRKWEFEMMHHITPLLFCTDEIAYFTMSLVIRTLLSDHVHITMEHILNVYINHLNFAEDGMSLVSSNGYVEIPLERNLFITGPLKLADAIPNTGIIGRENFQTGVQDAAKMSFDDKPIIKFHSDGSKLYVNSMYVHTYMSVVTDDVGAIKFKITTKPQDILQKAYQNSVVYAYFNHRPFITSEGVTTETPNFLRFVKFQPSNYVPEVRLPYPFDDGSTHITPNQNVEARLFKSYMRNLHADIGASLFNIQDGTVDTTKWDKYAQVHNNYYPIQQGEKKLKYC